MSNFDRADYEKAFDLSDITFVATSGDDVIGFLLGFPASQAHAMADYTAIQLLAELDDFVVCKQIAVSPRHICRGVARKLYRHLMSQLKPGQSLIAATVDEPPNNQSRKMHADLGFRHRCSIQHPDGLPRSVWEYVA